MKDYYKILGVGETATDDEIKKVFRDLSIKYHPDRNPDGEERFKEINEAYSILRDKEKRRKYDYDRKNPMGDFNMGQFGDFLNNFRRKSHREIFSTITPIQAYRGGDIDLTYDRRIMCDDCTGTGGEYQHCTSCSGNGFTEQQYNNGLVFQKIRHVCSKCFGRGYTLIHKCST